MPSGDPGAGGTEQQLDRGWEVACTPPGDAGAAVPAGLSWLPAAVPGTVAGALAQAGRWAHGDAVDLDAADWWFRTRFATEPAAAGEEVLLALDGIATVAEVRLNGALVLESESMFLAHRVAVGDQVVADNELVIRCRALRPLLAGRRRPRARWRTRLVADGNLRFFRTALLGRAPGFAPGPAPVGPWRPVRLERRRGLTLGPLELRPRVEGRDGVLAIRVPIHGADDGGGVGARAELSGPSGTHAASLDIAPARGGGLIAAGELRVRAAALWWPHTHGTPVLHHVVVRVAGAEGEAIAGARTGFRSLETASDPGDGLDLRVNGVPVFARGAVWTPADPLGLAADSDALDVALGHVRDAGLNLVRLAGTGTYESTAFHDRCDELGLLVWLDFMFANLDYPVADPAFRALVEAEARQALARVGGRPSTAVLCGNSEVEQQVAMLGLDPVLGRGVLFGELLPGLVAETGQDAIWVPSAPSGGDLPFRPDRGVANYFGVGGYRLPLDDARRAGVRFASECLALSNVPDDDALEAFGPAGAVVHHPRWKAGVPRDAGAGWDFEDVRDHYLGELFGVDAAALRRFDHERYLELSRAVSGEVMAEVFGEWRRGGSPCAGGIVLWLRDLLPGAGWGLLDHRGCPKVAYHHLRRALAPIAVWTTDERLGGVDVHVANDGPEPLEARLRVTLHADGEHLVGEAGDDLRLPPHAACTHNVETLLGRFVDAAWAYRFGPPGHDVVVATLERGGHVLAQAFRFPAGRPLTAAPAEWLGAEAWVAPSAGGLELTVRSRRVLHGVRVHVPGFAPADDAFSVAPGGARTVALRPVAPRAQGSGAAITALNLRGRLRVEDRGASALRARGGPRTPGRA